MDTAKTLRVFNGFFPYDYKALEQDINEYASKGWKLVSVGRFLMTYKRADTVGLCAHVEVFTGAYETENEKKLAAYKKSHEKDGWELIGDVDFFYIWYAPADTKFHAPTFEQEHNLMQKMVWSKELSALGLTLAMLVLGLVAILKCAYTDFLTFTGVGSLFILPLFGIPSILIGSRLVRDVRQQSAYLKRGETLPVPSVKAAKDRFLPVYWFLFIVGLYILLLFFFDAIYGYTRYLMMIIPLTLASVAILFLQKMPKNRARRTLIFCVLAVCGIGMFSLQRWSPPQADAPADTSVVLTLDAISDSPLKETYYRETVSPAVPAHYVYTETAESGASAQNEYFSIPFSPMRTVVLSKIRTLMAQSGSLTPGDGDAWTADEVYVSTNGAVLVLRGSEVFYYSAKDGAGLAAAFAPFPD
ncbi:MAG: DUF2812 domain-containing protein [Clostridiaceae bacterium]|nr:DUF2812 domain-containing protein [Clostridiaceae bacterium]